MRLGHVKINKFYDLLLTSTIQLINLTLPEFVGLKNQPTNQYLDEELNYLHHYKIL